MTEKQFTSKWFKALSLRNKELTRSQLSTKKLSEPAACYPTSSLRPSTTPHHIKDTDASKEENTVDGNPSGVDDTGPGSVEITMVPLGSDGFLVDERLVEMMKKVIKDNEEDFASDCDSSYHRSDDYVDHVDKNEDGRTEEGGRTNDNDKGFEDGVDEEEEFQTPAESLPPDPTQRVGIDQLRASLEIANDATRFYWDSDVLAETLLVEIMSTVGVIRKVEEVDRFRNVRHALGNERATFRLDEHRVAFNERLESLEDLRIADEHDLTILPGDKEEVVLQQNDTFSESNVDKRRTVADHHSGTRWEALAWAASMTNMTKGELARRAWVAFDEGGQERKEELESAK
ncbi:hypothetical protein M231_02976 [Tremella mesenterica]|uniref:Uncharacterized protein n=1 Tax=Tremella mesenterica TaxID=5217 RepID=A0A4Q1BPH9_TREME|nr:hypothetical protein M231_02976 [Tremella mesenterica]